MGLVTRDNLLVLLRKALVSDFSADKDLLSRSELSYEDLNQLNVTAAARTLVSQQQQAALQVIHTPHDPPPPTHTPSTSPGALSPSSSKLHCGSFIQRVPLPPLTHPYPTCPTYTPPPILPGFFSPSSSRPHCKYPTQQCPLSCFCPKNVDPPYSL